MSKTTTVKNSIGTFEIVKSNSGKTFTVTHISRGKPTGKKFYQSREDINFSAVRRVTREQKAWAKRWEEIQATARPHHIASCRGYCCVDSIGTKTYYNGKFGEGYIKALGRHRGSSFYTSIEYYIV